MRFPGTLRGSALFAALALAAPLAAQTYAPDLRAEATTDGPVEDYLRVLQVAGAAPLYPWSIRGFSPAEVDRLAGTAEAHPWSARFPSAPRGGAHARLLRPSVLAGFNSAYPAGGNDGAVWAGRGVTASATAGFALRWGVLSVRAEPVVFWAQNRSFDLMSNGQADSLRFNDADSPLTIDLPQRFGDGSFTRVDPGQSYARLDAGPLALGFSTANEHWGPTADLPLLLGSNAAGFPHAFVGTAHPVNVGLGRLHARVEWGSLAQSDFSTVSGHGSRRLMTGLLAVFTPRGLDGLEVGAGRFFHTAWPEGGLTLGDLTQPFQSILKRGLPVQDSTIPGADDRTSPDNQLASVFARWVLPGSGFEAWAEYAREDHNWDLRDAILEPDNSSGYSLGARKVWRRGESLLSLRAEWLETQQSNLFLVRNQARFYRHAFERQGHTQLGQVLGSPAAYGGAGSVVALDRYTPHGRWTLDWTRTRVRGLPPAAGDSGRVDVLHSVGGQAILFHRGLDVTAGLHGMYELNRNGGDDAFNLSATLGLRVGF